MDEGFGQELDGDTTAELGVGSLIHISHPSATEMGSNGKVCELCSDHECDECSRAAAILSEPRKSLTHLKMEGAKCGA